MLLPTILSSVFLLGTSYAVPHYSDVDSRYVIAPFNNFEFPMTPERCNPIGVGVEGYSQMATCIDEDTMEFTVYADDFCGTPVPSFPRTLTGNLDEVADGAQFTQTGFGTFFDFNCDDDKPNVYLELEFAAQGCDSPGVISTFFAAVGVCTGNTGIGGLAADAYEDLYVYCNETNAQLQIYDSPNVSYAVCDPDDLEYVATATQQCDFILASQGIPVYGALKDCGMFYTSATTETGTTSTDSSATTESPFNNTFTFDFNATEDLGFEINSISYGETVIGSTIGQPTIQPPNVEPCGSQFITGPGVVYELIGQEGTLTATTCSPDTTYDSKLFIFSGTEYDNLNCEGSNDDTIQCDFGSLKSTVEIQTTAGQYYYILVTGFSSDVGQFSLTVTGSAPPPTRYFVAPFLLAGVEVAYGVDFCQPYSDPEGAYNSFRASCLNEDLILFAQYSDYNCVDFVDYTLFTTEFGEYDGDNNTVFSQTGFGTLYDFNCDNSATDDYTEVKISLSPDCNAGQDANGPAGPFTVRLATEQCARGETTFLDTRATCNSDFASFEYFDTDGVSPQAQCDDYAGAFIATTTCGYFSDVIGPDLYAEMLTCSNSDPISSTVEPVSTSEPGNSLPTNGVDSRYVISVFLDFEFAIAMDTCNPVALVDNPFWVKGECIDEVTATLTVYGPGDTNCLMPINQFLLTGDESKADNETLFTKNGYGTLFDFNCDDDAINAYAEVEMFPQGCGSDESMTVFAALDACSSVTQQFSLPPSAYYNVRTYCQDDLAEVFFFGAQESPIASCLDENFLTSESFVSECSYAFTNNGTAVNGQLNECVIGDAAPQPNYNDFDARYFIGIFDDGEFPFALDRCNPLSPFSNDYNQLATCIDEDTLEFALYGDSECATPLPGYPLTFTGNLNEYYSSNGTAQFTQTGYGTLFDFNCDADAVDAYALLEANVFSCESGFSVQLYASLSTCAANTGIRGENRNASDYENINVYCDENGAELQIFSTPNETYGTCDAEDILFIGTIEEECGLVVQTENYPIFGTLLECNDGTVPPFSLDCQEMFGDVCLECDDNGCAQCASGYRRLAAGASGTYVCQEQDDEACTLPVSRCVAQNCGDGFENPYCGSFTSWGCTECQEGFFKKGNQFPCASCSMIAGCMSCSDFAGCTECEYGMVKYYDPVCGLFRCSDTCPFPQ